MMDWEALWTWLGNLAAGSSVIGLAIIVWQQIKQTKAAEEDIRAFIHLDLKKTNVNKNSADMLALVIYNSGDVSAENVFITSLDGKRWFALNGENPPEFTSKQSTLRVLPGEELEFLLGPTKELKVYFETEVKLSLSYKALPRNDKVFKDEQVLSMNPMRYLVRRQIH